VNLTFRLWFIHKCFKSIFWHSDKCL
jgi:hypothetical protein